MPSSQTAAARYTPNGRLNPRNILGTDANGDVLYAGGNVRRKRVAEQPAPEPVEATYCIQYFDEDGSLHTDWQRATDAEQAWEKAQAANANAYDFHAAEIVLD